MGKNVSQNLWCGQLGLRVQQMFRATNKRHRNSGQRSVSKGNGAEISTPEQKPDSKQGLRGEKLEDKAGA